MTLIRITAYATALAFFTTAVLPVEAQRRKKKDEETTQTLEVLPEPPSVISAETARLEFVTVPMSAKGLLSQQVRDGLRTLIRDTKKAPIVKIRAFVAGTGDMRRVSAIVSEELTDKRMPLPVVSVVQVGALPLDGAQVQIEAITLSKRSVNPNGLAFFSGQAVTREGPLQTRVLPLAEESLANLRKAVEAAGSTPADLLRLSCFMSSLEDVADVRSAAARLFPAAMTLLLQTQRAPAQTVVECEGVARLKTKPSSAVVFLNPPGLPASKAYSQVALVAAPQLAFAGSQLAFRYAEDDARLAFQRLEKTLNSGNSSLKQAVFVNTYPLSSLLMEMVRKVRFDFFDPARPPASTMLPFEGLPSMDGAFALEVVALPNSTSSPNP